MLNLLVALIAIIAALAAGYYIGKERAEIKNLRERLARMEAAQAKHLPYPTANGIEDATAALMRLKFEADFRQDLIDNALSHLQYARNGRKGN